MIVYLTHWFPRRDRSRALAWFFIGTPIAQIIGPPISGLIMAIGVGDNPADPRPGRLAVGLHRLGHPGGHPGLRRPQDADRLAPPGRLARPTTNAPRSQAELDREKEEHKAHAGHMTVVQALAHPKVLALAAAYFFVVTGNYGVELYMASILKDWYGLEVGKIAWLIIIPPIGSLIGQRFVGWNSDRTHERRWHASLPIIFGAITLAMTPGSKGSQWLTIALFTLAMTGLKAYLPAFWTLPSELMSASAAAASIGLINAFGNLGGWVGPTVVGVVRQYTGSYRSGLWFLAASMVVSAVIIIALGIGQKAAGRARARARRAGRARVRAPRRLAWESGRRYNQDTGACPIRSGEPDRHHRGNAMTMLRILHEKMCRDARSRACWLTLGCAVALSSPLAAQVPRQAPPPPATARRGAGLGDPRPGAGAGRAMAGGWARRCGSSWAGAPRGSSSTSRPTPSWGRPTSSSGRSGLVTRAPSGSARRCSTCAGRISRWPPR